ncbi:SDR family oxidoreductase [Variovorax sp. HJSM1_2]|uniref:SDR family oxidoreductase n=1 Tax=Variovorax sp. HJSM1_2 TaxID=3366263 RepID=UPI003BBDD23B
MNLGLDGKRALVLGGNRGIGQGIARALACEGAHVAITGRDTARLAQTAADLQAEAASAGHADVQVAGFALELAKTLELSVFVQKLLADFGPIDILVNNTGGPDYGGASGHSVEAWRSAFEEMVLPVIAMTDLLLPGMRARGWGRILTVVSSGVVQPLPILGISNSLRSALVPWSKTLSAEVARDGITANILVPGRIDTERVQLTDEAIAAKEGLTPEQVRTRSTSGIPMGRYGEPAEFGALAAFAASVPAAYITGAMLRCDGGNIRSI